MPPRKAQRQTLSDNVRNRRIFQRQRKQCPVTIVHKEDVSDDFLFASRHEQPKFRTAPKKKKKTVPKSPVISDVEISSDEEGAGQYKVPNVDDEDARRIAELNRLQDSLDNVSLELINNAGVRMKTVNGKIVGPHEKQPADNWKPACQEELVGTFPMRNKPHKKQKHVINRDKKQAAETKKVAEPLPQATLYEQLCKTIRNDIENETRKSVAHKNLQYIRVFGTPSRLNFERDDRLPFFNYTPIRGNQMNGGTTRFSTFSNFSPPPQNASTPIEKLVKERNTEAVPTLDFSVVSDNEEKGEEAMEMYLTSSAEKTCAFSSNLNSVTISNDTFLEKKPVFPNLMEVGVGTSETQKTDTSNTETAKEKSTVVGDDDDRSWLEPERPDDKSENEADETPIPTADTFVQATEQDATRVVEVDATSIPTSSSFRKAETSMTEMLVDSEEEQKIPDESYSKKRQRTKSPETMCLGTSTMLSIQDVDEKENEVGERKRGILQPQKQQLLRESRLSTMTTASSRRESINSLLEDMSIGLLDDDDDLLMMKTYASEGTTRLESRNQITAMTIRNDDPFAQPFYLDGMSFEVDPSDMKSLLFVAGQTEPKPWNSLPKGVLDGRKVKKLGEGSYGEVYSTKWDNTPVAIKVVPFEEDENNRKYHGEYHSGEMQIARAVLPELIIMKELSNLKNTELHDATPNFINLISTVIVQGVYPKGLLKAWNTYNDSVKESLNTSPDVYATKDQNFMLFVTENGGVALEDFELRSEDELRSIILQLMLSMQAAENALEFEHRDLHLGNVLIDRNGVEELTYKIKGFEVKIHAKGVKVNIIDFTLGRIRKDGSLVYLDLENDPDLFLSEGDPQFDVYRKMRAHCGGDWTKFEKKSNLMWIEYLANQLIDNENICPPNLLSVERKEELRQLIEKLGEYPSCSASFVDPPFFNQLYKDYMK